jgi:hypothetical protein
MFCHVRIRVGLDGCWLLWNDRRVESGEVWVGSEELGDVSVIYFFMIFFKNGDKFEGTITEEGPTLNGHGTFKFHDGTWYQGGIQAGLFEGEGTLHSKKATITGRWVKSIAHAYR